MQYISRNEIILFFICGILSALSCMNYSSEGANTVSMAFSTLYILLSSGLSLENQLYMMVFAIPNTKALGFGGISCSIIICSIVAVKYILFARNRPKITWGITLYLIYSLQFIVRFNDVMIGLVMPIKQVLNMLFFLVLAADKNIAKNSFVVGLKASLSLFGGIVFAFFFSSFTRNEFGRMAVAGNDPNILAIEAMFALCFISLAYINKLLPISIYGLALVLLSLVCTLCGSRMGLILLAIVLLSTILLNSTKAQKVIPVFLLIILTSVGFFFSSLGQQVLDNLMNRIELLEANDNITNGRFEIWDLYYTAINSSYLTWLFGLGDYTKFGIEDQAHNFFIEDLAGYGILGILIIYPTYFSIYKSQYHHSKRYYGNDNNNFYRFLPLFIPLIGGLTLHGLASIMNTTMLYLGTLALTKAPTKTGDLSKRR